MIQRATEQDLDEVMRLERSAATAPHWTPSEYAGMVGGDDGGSVRRTLLVDREGGGLRGFAVGRVTGMAGDGEAELESVVVSEAARRQGLGAALCRAVMEWGRAEGARCMTLEVRAGSAGAVRLYERLGFVEAGRRKEYYRTPDEDAVVMRCVLHIGDEAGN